MNITIGFIGVIISVITTGIMLDNSIQGRMDVTRSGMREDMNILRSELRDEMGDFKSEMRNEMGDFKSEMRNEMNALQSGVRAEIKIIRSDIQDLQSRVSSIEGKLALLIEAWGIAQPSPPAIAKQ